MATLQVISSTYGPLGGFVIGDKGNLNYPAFLLHSVQIVLVPILN